MSADRGLSNQDEVPRRGETLLLQQVLKLNCETCRLKTEHYVEILNGMVVMCRCLKCGKVRMNPQLTREELQPYPVDSARPVYVC